MTKRHGGFVEQQAGSKVSLSSAARTRFKWIELYQQIGDAGVVCRRCGISRPTLRKWLYRFQAQGVAGLEFLSRRPLNSRTRKVSSDLELAILQIREEKGLGARRIKSDLIHEYGIELSQTAIQRVLDRHDIPPLTRERRRHVHKRYNASFPG